jgi:hypothetical protein
MMMYFVDSDYNLLTKEDISEQEDYKIEKRIEELKESTGKLIRAFPHEEITKLLPEYSITYLGPGIHVGAPHEGLIKKAAILGYKVSIIYREGYQGSYLSLNFGSPKLIKYYINRKYLGLAGISSPLDIRKDYNLIQKIKKDFSVKAFRKAFTAWERIGEKPTEDMSRHYGCYMCNSNQSGYTEYEYLLFYRKY